MHEERVGVVTARVAQVSLAGIYDLGKSVSERCLPHNTLTASLRSLHSFSVLLTVRGDLVTQGVGIVFGLFI